jgi:putative SOS response-associated peptidase YedK
MCGRYALADLTDLQLRFHLEDQAMKVPKRFNIAPTQLAAVVRRNSPNRLDVLRWGLTPPWMKTKSRSLINARSETVATSRAFKPLLRRYRVIVPASGWYEWKKMPKGPKQPHYFRRKDERLLGFAGLVMSDELGEAFVIITTAANDLAAEVHDRMPAILDEDDAEDLWLDPDVSDLNALHSLLGPYPEELLVGYPVSRLVNKAGFDDAAMVEPIAA